MRGEVERQAALMLGLTPDDFVPKDHPLRRIKPLVDSVLRRMSPLFDDLYRSGGRPSIPPEQLFKSSLLMAFYTVRSEPHFCEQLRYNLLYKWFLDLNVEDEPLHPTTAGGAARSTVARPGIPATVAPRVGASGSKRCSAGSRRSVPAASCATWAGPATSSGSN